MDKQTCKRYIDAKIKGESEERLTREEQTCLYHCKGLELIDGCDKYLSIREYLEKNNHGSLKRLRGVR